MKKTLIFALLAVTALFASCEKEIPSDDGPIAKGTVLEARLSDLTKTAIDGAKVSWTTDDAICVNGVASSSVSIDGETASFSFAQELSAPYSAVSPASIYKNAETVTLPASWSGSSFGIPLYAYLESGEAVRVFAVHGSLVLLRTEAFLGAGAYDENIFLYCEEHILARRLCDAGWETFLVTFPCYRHAGGGTTGKAGGAAVRQKHRQQSERYYYRQYLGAGPLQLCFVRIFQAVVYLETLIGEKLGLI